VKLRTGFTTGSCAAAAAKAGCLLLKGDRVGDQVTITLPDGQDLAVPIHWARLENGAAVAEVIKDSGDDPDITNGLEIRARVRVTAAKGEVRIAGGRGVGQVTKKGLPVPVGESAINPGPRKMIQRAVRDVFFQEGIEVVIEVPRGEEVAPKTLNPRLGIVGGISILGTSGIVRPMSEEAFKASILPELDQALAYGHRTVVFTPGNYGFRVAVNGMGIPPEAVIQTSNFIGFLLEEAVTRGIKRILLLGHVGKLIKVAGGIFHTHNRVADARKEILIAHAALNGIPCPELHELSAFPTVEGAALALIEHGHGELLHKLAELASDRVRQYTRGQIDAGTIFTLFDGTFIGWDDSARRIVDGAHWNWPAQNPGC